MRMDPRGAPTQELGLSKGSPQEVIPKLKFEKCKLAREQGGKSIP